MVITSHNFVIYFIEWREMFASLDTYQSENDSINKEELPTALASCDVDSTSSEIHRMLGEADSSWLIKRGQYT